jgi:hypothetical protein
MNTINNTRTKYFFVFNHTMFTNKEDIERLKKRKIITRFVALLFCAALWLP